MWHRILVACLIMLILYSYADKFRYPDWSIGLYSLGALSVMVPLFIVWLFRLTYLKGKSNRE